MRYYFIVNPIAGAGLSSKLFSETETLLRSKDIAYRAIYTEYPGHAKTLTKDAIAAGETVIVAVGGDGTFREVAETACGAGVTVGLLPFGTGNDLARALKVPSGVAAATEVLLKGHTRKMDAGRINDSIFFNAAGLGFDVDVLINMERLKTKYTGMLPYLLGVFKALLHLKKVALTYEIDGQAATMRATIFVVANGTHFGGGMHVAPGADPFDGMFDVCAVDSVSVPRFLALLPSFVKGRHGKLKPVRHFPARELTITTETPCVVQLDGELLEKTPAKFSVLHEALSVIVPGEDL